jgi:hypothetical protein
MVEDKVVSVHVVRAFGIGDIAPLIINLDALEGSGLSSGHGHCILGKITVVLIE